MKVNSGQVTVSRTTSGGMALTVIGESAGSWGTVLLSPEELAKVGTELRDAAWHGGGAQ